MTHQNTFTDIPKWLTLRNALIILTIILFLVAWNRGIALLYGLFALILAILLISHLAPMLVLRGLSATRTHPEKAYEGDEIKLLMQLSNKTWFSRYMIELWDQTPFMPPKIMAFVPGVKRTETLTMTVTCDWRGLHTLGPLTLKTGYPLGISTAQQTLANTTTSLLVYPTAFPIQHFHYLSSPHLPLSGTNAVAMSGGSDVFFGVREYRRGDNPRHIHWPSTAHKGQFIVKEYEFIATTEITLLLDLHKNANYGEGKHSTLEYAVKIAASIARHALTHRHHVCLLGYGQKTLHLPPASSEKHYQVILEALARVRADGETTYAETIQRALPSLRQGSVLVLFDNSPPNTTVQPFPLFALQTRHIKPVWIRFQTDSFLQPETFKPSHQTSNIPSYTICRGDDLARVFATYLIVNC
jgi:uncharacterized protein (DUF58 family)